MRAVGLRTTGMSALEDHGHAMAPGMRIAGMMAPGTRLGDMICDGWACVHGKDADAMFICHDLLSAAA